ncbi:class I SAM-dependent methyltransferase [Lentibacillus jeotgali]|uniref:class I SAM-dependent methyltransferase n=1 Tax=Lentibacillus jeotgali TaxID=558169 RepID=UPI0002625C67|nr:class I SAM-dependent methyltransferase [Lentibacillus jeotgali]
MENNSYIDALALMGVGGAHPGGLQLTKNILSRENIDEEMSVLDAGCGTGQTAAYIAEQFQCHVTALDNSNIMLDKARRRFSDGDLPVKIRQGNIENLPFPDDSFETALSESVIAFTDIRQSISELNRILKPDGVLYAVEMVMEKKLPEYDMKPIIDFYGVTRLLSESEWRDLFQEVGFQQIISNSFKQQVENVDLNDGPDFSLSENMSDETMDILLEHDRLTKLYEDRLGFRIFRCSV